VHGCGALRLGQPRVTRSHSSVAVLEHGTPARPSGRRTCSRKSAMSKILKASGPTVAILRFDTARTSGMRPEQVQQITYHIGRLLTGQGTARSEWDYFGISIDVEDDCDQGEE